MVFERSKASKPRCMRVAVLAATSALLVLAYFSFGYIACAEIPLTTRALAEASIDATSSPFDKDSLVRGALATRDYSFGSHDIDSYYEVISSMNKEAKTPYAENSEDSLLTAPVEYTIDSEALSHLDDVANIAYGASAFALSVMLLAIVFCYACFRIEGMSLLGRSLICAGAAVIFLLAFFGVWAAVSFESLFSSFHSLFFTSGTWVFPADSLLITMLPQGFWVGMAVVWLSASALLALASLAVGIALARRHQARNRA